MHKQPNLLIVMADQLRAEALGVHGNPVVQTPCLDAFARESVDVRHYFANCPVCVPSRVTLFTGRYPHSHRIRENHTLPEAGAEMHLFRVLKQAGYALGYVGKNHLLRHEEFANFDFVDLENSAAYPSPDTPYHHVYTDAEQAYRRFECEQSHRMAENGAFAGAKAHDFPEEVTEPHVFADSAIRFLNSRAGEAKPFCLCVSWVQPHAPHIAHESLRRRYDGVPVPQADTAALADKAGRYLVKYKAQRAHLATAADKENFIATYYAMVTAIDRQFGRLCDTLTALGMEENTVVLFTSDHGEFLFENGLCKKDLVLTDDLLRVPFLLRHKGALAPRVVDGGGMMEEVDVLPTLLDMLDLRLPLGVQGRSALAYLRGETDCHKDAVYAEICAPWQYNPYPTFEDMEADWQHRYGCHAPLNVPGDFTKSIRTRTHRYVWYATGEQELYDLRHDPRERKNMAALPAHQGELLDLKLRLLEWAALSEDPLDPKLCAKNQKAFANWRPTKTAEDAEGGPGWIEQAYGR